MFTVMYGPQSYIVQCSQAAQRLRAAERDRRNGYIADARDGRREALALEEQFNETVKALAEQGTSGGHEDDEEPDPEPYEVAHGPRDCEEVEVFDHPCDW